MNQRYHETVAKWGVDVKWSGFSAKLSIVKTAQHLRNLLFNYVDETKKHQVRGSPVSGLGPEAPQNGEEDDRDQGPQLRPGIDFVPWGRDIMVFGHCRKPLAATAETIGTSPSDEEVSALAEWWLREVAERKKKAHHWVFSIDPRMAHCMASIGYPIGGPTMALAADSLSEYVARYYPGETLGYVMGMHYDTIHPHAHCLLFPTTNTGKDLNLSPLAPVVFRGKKTRADCQGTLQRSFLERANAMLELMQRPPLERQAREVVGGSRRAESEDGRRPGENDAARVRRFSSRIRSVVTVLRQVPEALDAAATDSGGVGSPALSSGDFDSTHSMVESESASAALAQAEARLEEAKRLLNSPTEGHAESLVGTVSTSEGIAEMPEPESGDSLRISADDEDRFRRNMAWIDVKADLGRIEADERHRRRPFTLSEFGGVCVAPYMRDKQKRCAIQAAQDLVELDPTASEARRKVSGEEPTTLNSPEAQTTVGELGPTEDQNSPPTDSPSPGDDGDAGYPR
jgi:hypothetical protein